MTVGDANNYYTVCDDANYDGVDLLNENCYKCQGTCSKCNWLAGASNNLCIEECTQGSTTIYPTKGSVAIVGLCVNSCETGFFIKTVSQSITG